MKRLLVLLVALSVVALLVARPAQVAQAQCVPGPCTPTFTPTSTSTVTPTPTVWVTLTPGPTATVAMTPADNAHWRWPVCGALADREIPTFFDHYLAEWQVWPTESALHGPGDGLDFVVPYNGKPCTGLETDSSTWCGENLVGRSQNRSYTEFANNLPLENYPRNLVVSPHSALVQWVGPVTRLGYENPSTTRVCNAGGWQLGVRLQFHSGEFVVIHGLSAVFVTPGERIVYNQAIGVSSASVSWGNPWVYSVVPLRAMQTSQGRWFDSLGWGDETGVNGKYEAFKPRTDPNFIRGNVPSPRRIDPFVAQGIGCPTACGSQRIIVDTVTCATCSAPITDPSSVGGSYHIMEPSGTSSDTGFARWTATGSGPGTYGVYAQHRFHVADGRETSSAARYRVGTKTIVASQKADGTWTEGWYYLGTFTYPDAPYLELENGAYTDLLFPEDHYIDSDECATLVVDAAMFVPLCSGPPVSGGAVTGTPPPAASATPNCLTIHCGGE